MLSCLAVLPGEFGLALAEACVPPPAAAEVGHLLTRLVERSLVSTSWPEHGPARYRLLAVVRQFVRQRTDPGVLEEVSRRHAVFCDGAAAAAVRARCHGALVTGPADRYDQADLLAALGWAASRDPGLADRLLIAASQLAETEPTRQALELIRDLGLGHPHWSAEALAWSAVTVCYLNLDDARRLAQASSRAAAVARDHALASLASGWIDAYRQDEQEAVRRLGEVLDYAADTTDPWLAGSALQARGVARAAPGDAFADWEEAVARFAAAGDILHANNVRYMLAGRAVETRARLADVPVWLDECESYAARRGLVHELAHIRLVRAGLAQIRGLPGPARELLGTALPVFRQAGDFRCVARALLQLADPAITEDPAEATRLLLECLPAALLAGGRALQGQVLARLMEAGAAAGDLVLAARSRGALESLGNAPPPAGDPALTAMLQEPAYATFVSEGRAGRAELLINRYA